MPSERVGIVKRGFEAFNRGEFETIDAFLHDEVVAEVPEPFAAADVYRGREGFARMLGEWAEPWDELRIEVQELIEEGDAVYAPSIQRGRGTGSGVAISMPTVFLLRFQGDRIVLLRLCQTLDEARARVRDI